MTNFEMGGHLVLCNWSPRGLDWIKEVHSGILAQAGLQDIADNDLVANEARILGHLCASEDYLFVVRVAAARGPPRWRPRRR